MEKCAIAKLKKNHEISDYFFTWYIVYRLIMYEINYLTVLLCAPKIHLTMLYPRCSTRVRCTHSEVSREEVHSKLPAGVPADDNVTPEDDVRGQILVD